jgi:hypothetical protein
MKNQKLVFTLPNVSNNDELLKQVRQWESHKKEYILHSSASNIYFSSILLINLKKFREFHGVGNHFSGVYMLLFKPKLRVFKIERMVDQNFDNLIACFDNFDMGKTECLKELVLSGTILTDVSQNKFNRETARMRRCLWNNLSIQKCQVDINIELGLNVEDFCERNRKHLVMVRNIVITTILFLNPILKKDITSIISRQVWATRFNAKTWLGRNMVSDKLNKKQ